MLSSNPTTRSNGTYTTTLYVSYAITHLDRRPASSASVPSRVRLELTSRMGPLMHVKAIEHWKNGRSFLSRCSQPSFLSPIQETKLVFCELRFPHRPLSTSELRQESRRQSLSFVRVLRPLVSRLSHLLTP